MDDMMQIQGEWMNKNTGKKIRVRNSIIDGDQMIIITNMGQISMEEFSRNYVQASDEVYDDEGNVIATEKMTSQPSEQSNIKIETINDQEYFIDDKPVSFDNLIEKPIVQQNINNIDLIKKVFDKIDSKPQITVDIKWDNFPKEQISTLVKFLDVNVEDIAKYLCSEYVNVDFVETQVSDMINKNI